MTIKVNLFYNNKLVKPSDLIIDGNNTIDRIVNNVVEKNENGKTNVA